MLALYHPLLVGFFFKLKFILCEMFKILMSVNDLLSLRGNLRNGSESSTTTYMKTIGGGKIT